jgi:hypothetical protein
MSATRIPPAFLAALRQIMARLAESDVVWAVTGSLGLTIKGIPFEPHDIDIQTDRAGVEAFARLFADAMTTPPHLWESDHTRSWHARFEIEGVPVEVMGDVQHRNEEGVFDPPLDVGRHRIFIQVGEMLVPTLTLEVEEEAYRRMGRLGKANRIGQYLRLC